MWHICIEALVTSCVSGNCWALGFLPFCFGRCFCFSLRYFFSLTLTSLLTIPNYISLGLFKVLGVFSTNTSVFLCNDTLSIIKKNSTFSFKTTLDHHHRRESKCSGDNWNFRATPDRGSHGCEVRRYPVTRHSQ